jgi:hypothetical protein
MITTIVKWVSLAASLLLAALSWTSRSGTGVLLIGFVVFAGLVATVFQAYARRKFGWIFLLIPLAILSNPVIPVATAPVVSLSLNLACAATFAACLLFLRHAPRMTIDSITSTSTSESL